MTKKEQVHVKEVLSPAELERLKAAAGNRKDQFLGEA